MNIIERSLSGVNFSSRKSALTPTYEPKGHKRLLPFVTIYHPAVKTNIDGILESDTQSALAEDNFYKTSDHLFLKGKIP